MQFTQVALDQVLPVDTSQQNSILKQMVCQLRNKVHIYEQELRQLNLQLQTGKNEEGRDARSVDIGNSSIQQLNDIQEQNKIRMASIQKGYEEQLKISEQQREKLLQYEHQLQALQIDNKTAMMNHKNQVDELQRQLKAAQEPNENIARELHYQKCDNKRIINESNTKIKQLKQVIDEERAKQQSLHETIADLREDIATYQQQYNSVYHCSDTQNIMGLMKQLKQQDQVLEQKDAEIQSLHKEMQETIRKHESMKEEALRLQKEQLEAEKQSEINDLTKRQTDASQRTAMLTDQQIGALQSQISDLTLLNQDLSMQVKQLMIKDKNNILQQQMLKQKYDKAVQRAKLRYETLAVQLTGQIESTQVALEGKRELSQDKMRLKETIATQREELRVERANVEHAKLQLQGALAQNQHLQVLAETKERQVQVVNQLRFELNQMSLEKQRIVAALDECRTGYAHQEDELRMARADIRRLETLLVQKDETIKGLHARISSVETDVRQSPQQDTAQPPEDTHEGKELDQEKQHQESTVTQPAINSSGSAEERAPSVAQEGSKAQDEAENVGWLDDVEQQETEQAKEEPSVQQQGNTSEEQRIDDLGLSVERESQEEPSVINNVTAALPPQPSPSGGATDETPQGQLYALALQVSAGPQGAAPQEAPDTLIAPPIDEQPDIQGRDDEAPGNSAGCAPPAEGEPQPQHKSKKKLKIKKRSEKKV